MKTKLRIVGWLVLLALSMFNLQLSTAHAQGTAFTYQGRLNNGANPTTGIYDLRFTIYDAVGGGSASGVLTNAATPVTNGLFTVTLDFGGGVFTGNARWLEIAVRTNGATAFTTLAPRQPVTPTPYAILAGSATTASTAANVPASGIGAGTANISITGNAGTATSAAYAGSAAMAYTAVTATAATTATNLIGNVSDAQLSANVARLNGTNNFTGTNTFVGVTIATNVNNVFAGTFLGNGGGLTNLNTAQFANSVLTNNQTGVTLNGTFAGNGASLTNVNAAALNGLSATSFWQLGGNNVSGGQFLGSTNSQALEFKVNNVRALRLEPTTTDSTHSNIVNVVGGSPVNTIASGVYGSVIAGGGAANYSGITPASNSISSDMSFLGGGWGNSIQLNASSSFLGGGVGNSIQTNAYFSFLGGGQRNSIQTNAYTSFLGGGNGNSIQTNAQYSVLGGGNGNSIQPIAQYSVLGGGSGNSIQLNAWQSFLGGGQDNSIQPNAYRSFLGGGYYNSIQTNADNSFLGGGSGNSIQLNAGSSFLGGGSGNSIQTSAYQSFLGGGLNNSIQTNAYRSFLGGGYNNSIQLNDYYSFLGGGTNNSIQANASYSVLGGGQDNSIQLVAYYSFLGGGLDNSIQTNAQYSVLGGGRSNVVSGVGAVVVGGGFDGSSTLGNTASGAASVVVGGCNNAALGNFSFAAGYGAQANYKGDFVWADSQVANFNSTANDQFLIRVQGGVGINTNNPNGAALNVNGSVVATSFSGFGAGLTSLNAANLTGTIPLARLPAAVVTNNESGVTLGGLNINGANLVMNDKDIQLRSTYDHGIGWYGSGKPFAGVSVDGPVVYGYGGGGLGIVHSGSTSNIVVYWNSSGYVGIGTTSPDALLTVNGAADKPGGGSWSTFSDVRLKKNIQPLSGVLQKLLTLRGVSFEYKEPEKIHELSGERIGMIAQEVEQVFPDWVESGPEGYKRLTYRGFEALTVEALRELRDEKDVQLQARDAEMQGLNLKMEQKETEITELKARLERLEQLVTAKNGGGR